MTFCFFAERTLGKLAKWLRLLGFDTEYESHLFSATLPETVQPERILLTRTHRVRTQCGSQRLVFIEPNDPQDQLKTVIGELGILREHIRPFSRCLSCNSEIVAIEKDAVFGKVPDYVWQTHAVFHACPICNRIYWPGSHTQRSLERIAALFE